MAKNGFRNEKGNHVVRILSFDTFYLKNRVLRQEKTCCSETSFTNIWSPNASKITETTEIISKDAVGRDMLGCNLFRLPLCQKLSGRPLRRLETKKKLRNKIASKR